MQGDWAACGAAVLLIQALSAWNDAHGGRLPASAEEKAQFRALLVSWQRSADGVLMQVRARRASRVSGL